MLINISQPASSFISVSTPFSKKNSVVFNKFDFVNIDNLKSAYSDKIFQEAGIDRILWFSVGKTDASDLNKSKLY